MAVIYAALIMIPLMLVGGCMMSCEEMMKTKRYAECYERTKNENCYPEIKEQGKSK